MHRHDIQSLLRRLRMHRLQSFLQIVQTQAGRDLPRKVGGLHERHRRVLWGPGLRWKPILQTMPKTILWRRYRQMRDDGRTTFYSFSNNDNESSSSCCGDYECVGDEYYKSCQLKAGAAWLPRWGDCTNDVDRCCDGLQCVGNQYYRSCTKN